MTPLTDIECFEAGSMDQKPWVGTTTDLRADMDALERLAEERLIKLIVKRDSVKIFGKDRIGLVILPSSRRLIIRTKIKSLEILKWLVYLEKIPSLDTWLEESGFETGDDTDIYGCIAKLFLREMDIITRRHIRKDYVAATSEGSFVRGRILVSQLAKSVHRLPRLPMSCRNRSLDTSYNSVLALALDRLRIFFSKSSNDRSNWARLRDQWTSIRRDILDPATAVTEAQWACPPGYRNAIQLARLILLGLSIEPTSLMGGQAFTLSLALIWEDSLLKMFTELKDKTGWIPVVSSQRTRKWDDSNGNSDPSRSLRTDVMLEQNLSRWVLDAKYKCAYGIESREDRFQMCAYALAFDANRATLVFPSASNGEHQGRTLLRATIETKSLVIDAINLPMSSGPQACLDALMQICTGIPNTVGLLTSPPDPRLA